MFLWDIEAWTVPAARPPWLPPWRPGPCRRRASRCCSVSLPVAAVGGGAAGCPAWKSAAPKPWTTSSQSHYFDQNYT